MSKTNEIELLVSAMRITESDIPAFQVGMRMTNTSSEPIAFEITDSALFVNSARNMAWDLAVQNGTAGNIRIAPQASEQLMWPLGEALFESSGVYELKLVMKSLTDVKKVTILPD
jgi:hypothetical protein